MINLFKFVWMHVILDTVILKNATKTGCVSSVTSRKMFIKCKISLSCQVV